MPNKNETWREKPIPKKASKYIQIMWHTHLTVLTVDFLRVDSKQEQSFGGIL